MTTESVKLFRDMGDGTILECTKGTTNTRNNWNTGVLNSVIFDALVAKTQAVASKHGLKPNQLVEFTYKSTPFTCSTEYPSQSTDEINKEDDNNIQANNTSSSAPPPAIETTTASTTTKVNPGLFTNRCIHVALSTIGVLSVVTGIWLATRPGNLTIDFSEFFARPS